MPERLSAVIRPARPDDFVDILELVSRIWGEEDYIPQAWAGWLDDRQGCLLVAECDGRAIALGHLPSHLAVSHLATGREPGAASADWWLEGLRVHPDYQGRGIASQLFDALLAWQERHGGGALRLATTGRNLAVHHLCARRGLVKIGEYSDFEAALLEGGANFQPAGLEEAGEALTFAQNSPLRDLTLEYMDLGRGWLPPRLRQIQAAIQDGQAFWWQGREGLLLCCEDPEEKRPGIVQLVSLAACPRSRLSDFLLDFRRLGRQRGYQRVGWFAPLSPALVKFLEAAGFQRTWDGTAYLFEKKEGL